MEYKHVSVLLNECIEGLNLKQNQNIIDCTLGGAGHSKEILEKIAPKGKLIGFDLDSASIENAKKVLKGFEKRIYLINDNFKNIQKAKEVEKGIKINGVLMDLGISSYELDDESRGFSFKGENPLNMSFSGDEDFNAEYVLNTYSLEDLRQIFRDYGEEQDAHRIAQEIVSYRKEKEIKTTKDLVEIVCKAKKCLPYLEGRLKHIFKIHPATKVFQALRIEVNGELESLKEALPKAIDLLESGCRLAVITFHSLEDRIVKECFKLEATDCICDPEIPICMCKHKRRIKLVNRKPIIPSEDEIRNNPRARSSKLRIIEKV